MSGDRRDDTSSSGVEDVPPWDRRAFGSEAGGDGSAWDSDAGADHPIVWTEPEDLADQPDQATGRDGREPYGAPGEDRSGEGRPAAGRLGSGQFLSGGLPLDEPRPASAPHASAGGLSGAHDLQQLTVLGHDDQAKRRRKAPLMALGVGAVAMLMAAAAGGWVWARSGLEPTAPTTSVSAGQTVPAGQLVAADYFERTASSGFGKALLGGTWKLLAKTADERSHYKVDQGRANLEIDAGVRCTAWLPKTPVVSSDVLTSFATDTQPTAGGLYVGLMTRATGVSHGLLTDVFIQRDKSVRVRLQKVVGAGKGDVTTIDSTTRTLPGSLPRDAVLYIRTQTIGTAPTILRTKVWWGERAGEPTDWSSESRIEGDEDFREPGSVALTGYLSKEAATASVNVSLFAVEGWDIPG